MGPRSAGVSGLLGGFGWWDVPHQTSKENVCLCLESKYQVLEHCFFCDCEGGRELKDEYGLYDSMTPVSAVATDEGLTIAIYLTKPPVRGVHLQEIHLLKMIAPPADIAAVYHGRQ